MTNIEAIKAKMFPYSLPTGIMEALLEEQDLSPSEDYVKAENSVDLTRAAINGLYQAVGIKEESDNGSTVKYDTDAIMALIRRLEESIGEEKKPINRDRTRWW